MLTLVEALNFRCLRYISRPMDRFHVLIGPNASGKTTFLDVVGFLGEMVSEGLDTALASRSPTFEHLLFGRQGNRFELAVEAAIPNEFFLKMEQKPFTVVRYRVVINQDVRQNEVRLLNETLSLQSQPTETVNGRVNFPDSPPTRQRLTRSRANKSHERMIINKTKTGRAEFFEENYRSEKTGWAAPFRLGHKKSALANLPEDESKFPVATWFKQFLTAGVQPINLDNVALRTPSPPRLGRRIMANGGNLPWVIEDLRKRNRSRFVDWKDHVRTALPDLVDVKTIERPEDRHRYIVLVYAGDLEVPSWLVSDGTLRLLALTLPAYLDNLEGMLLIEEPENGIHPRAVEALFESLSQVDRAQVLLATHSPIILSIVEPQHVLCFAKDDTGSTDIVAGNEHPRLQDWQRDVPLGDLFAAGVLG